MLKYFYLSLISLLVPLFLVGTVFADVVCQPIYGGGQTCVTTGNILVNKKVCKPEVKDECKAERGDFVENFGTNTPFSANQIVTFQILVKNTGGNVIQQTSIRDTFPGFVSFVSGNGIFDNNTKTLTFTTDNLAPNEERPFIIKGRTSDLKDLPDGVTCVVNQAIATTNAGQMSQDNSQFCIQKTQITTKGGLPVFPSPKITTTPPTGPELIPLIGLLPAGIGGWFLRRKSILKRGGEK